MNSFRTSVIVVGLSLGLVACAGNPGPAPSPSVASCGATVETAVVRALASAGVAGCATELNLRLMLVEPRDLAGGRTADGPSGDAAFAAVRRHGRDKVKPLSPSSASGPGGD